MNSTGSTQTPAERPVDDGKAAAVFDIHIKFADDPFHNQDRNAQDQKQDNE